MAAVAPVEEVLEVALRERAGRALAEKEQESRRAGIQQLKDQESRIGDRQEVKDQERRKAGLQGLKVGDSRKAGLQELKELGSRQNVRPVITVSQDIKVVTVITVVFLTPECCLAATHPSHPPRLHQIPPRIQEMVQRVFKKGHLYGG